MNIYFLVEGQSTEADVYPAWLSHLIPELKRVYFFDEVEQNNYYLFSSHGIPYIEKDIIHAIEDINTIKKYTYFVISLDADAVTVAERESKIHELLKNENIVLNKNTSLIIIVQNRCIETWFLGNRKIFTRNPQNDSRFIQYSRFYDVCQNDPELMGIPKSYDGSISDFHFEYLKAMFREKENMRYSKSNSKEVQKKSYFQELNYRTHDNPNHLLSFSNFINFCLKIQNEIGRRSNHH